MYKVLIVDDEPFITEGLPHLIDWQTLNLEIVARCYDGKEALEVLSQQTVHIVITDVNMPEMDGLTLIRKAHLQQPQLKFIILSGFDDYKYLKEAIVLGIENYLLKPVSEHELRSTLHNAIAKIESELFHQIEFRQGQFILRDNIMHRWVTGEIHKKELLERASFLDIPLDSDAYLCVVLKILDVPNAEHAPKINNKNLLQFAICNICQEIVTSEKYAAFKTLCFCDSSGDVILVVMNGSSRWKDEITPMLEQCGAQVQTLLKADLLFLVGTIEPTFSDIHHSYTHATQLQDYRMWSVPNTVLFYDELKQSADAMQNRWKLDLKRFQDLITEKKQEEALVFIDYAYEQLIAMRPPDSKLVREVTAEMLFHIKFVLRMLSPQASLLQEGFSALVFAAYHQSGIEQLKSTVRQTLIETIAFLNHSDQEISPFIRKVMDRIHQKYADNINLSLLADEFRINPVYLGHLFKKETGEIFNNYLNRIRIEEAKRLLQQRPDLKTSDIALEVGYANTNYFYTIFKKITGQSPTDFRRELGG